MTVATLTTKGQVTIPAAVRQALHVDAGDRLEFVEVVPGRFEIVPLTRSITELKGLAAKRKKPVTLEEMKRAISARGAASR